MRELRGHENKILCCQGREETENSRYIYAKYYPITRFEDFR